MSGRVIWINGTSSAGKTTLTRAIQERADTPWLATGIDAFFASVPEPWGGGRGGPLSREGFAYDRSVSEEGHPVTVIRYGPAGRRMLRAMHAATAAMAESGNDVIVDELLLTPDLMGAWTEALGGVRVLWVGLHCPLPVLEARERERGQVAGLARGHLGTVHAHGRGYDLELDGAGAVEGAVEAVLGRV
ncbi:AAA family ATPase [Phytomonospora sp. NPDC050363]|uniref:chloramphenicol phosphotransferase CPT family protein n=1 Tax=Phytomonospora sp. NPDC050363 TaxID=3155642 RepID=UPI0033E8D1A3